MYNGYTNYETWVILLWIENDPTSEWSARATEISETIALADELEANFQEKAEAALPEAGPLTDLLGHALTSVNWLEVAECVLDNALAD